MGKIPYDVKGNLGGDCFTAQSAVRNDGNCWVILLAEDFVPRPAKSAVRNDGHCWRIPPAEDFGP